MAKSPKTPRSSAATSRPASKSFKLRVQCWRPLWSWFSGAAAARVAIAAKARGTPPHYLTCKQQGKTRSVYVPQDLLKEVQSWIREHQRLKKLSQHISQLVLAQVQTHVTDRRRKDGKS